MFSGIAPRYDLLNHLLSFNVDRSWRKTLKRRLAPVLQRPDARILDLCCGTGDVMLDLQSISALPIIGADFCHPMLVTARRKAAKHGFIAPLIEADALEFRSPRTRSTLSQLLWLSQSHQLYRWSC